MRRRTTRSVVRRARKALAEEYLALYDGMNDASYVVSQAGVILQVNQPACESLGYTREELVGMPVAKIDGHPNREYVLARVREITAERGVVFETIHVKKDGAFFPVEVSSRVVTFRGRPALFSVVRDITDWKCTQAVMEVYARELMEANEQAQAASRAKGAFLAHMSHEIRTPLGGILGMAELLETTQLDAEQLEYVQTLRRSGEELLQMINDVLDLAKLEAGRMEALREPFEVRTVVEESVGLMKPKALLKGLRVRVELPSGAERVVGDAHKVKQILLNLLGNAIKFTERGEVGVKVERAGARYRMTVWDTGCGVAPEKVPQLFQRFVQVDASAARRYQGTGLGLSICRQLAELLGGQVEVKSELGRGSSFTLELELPAAV